MRVTAILAACGFRQWPACISAADREFYLNRGTQIHLTTQLYDLGTLDESSVDPRIKGFLEAWKLFRLQVGGEILAQEREVENKVLGYQGRLDLILGPCGVCKFPTVADKKTNKADTFTRLQLSGYRQALPRFKNMKRMAVSLFSNGKYKSEVYDNDVVDDLTWRECCNHVRSGAKLADWLKRNNMELEGEYQYGNRE